MFETKEELRAEIKLLKDQLGIAEMRSLSQSKELIDALKAKKDAEYEIEFLTTVRKELESRLDASGIMMGTIIRIERDYAPDAHRSGNILTVRMYQPIHPMSSYIGRPCDENGRIITDEKHPKLKPIMDRYRHEMDVYNGFHIGAVDMKMPRQYYDK